MKIPFVVVDEDEFEDVEIDRQTKIYEWTFRQRLFNMKLNF